MLMPTGNEDVWMIRVRDRGITFKIDLLELLKAAGQTTDAWGQELPGNRGEQVKATIAKAKARKKKNESKTIKTPSND